MNMRYSRGYIWWAWLLLFLFSCAEYEQAVDPGEPGEVRMSMNISTRATNDPEVLNVNENRISRLRIYVFDGTSLDKMYYWSGLTDTDGTYTTPVFTVKAATGKTLYAIVNEPVDVSTRAILESVDHPNDLLDVQYKMEDYLATSNNVVEYTKEYCLPMYGELAGVDAAEGTTQTVHMRVDRAVARVDVYMRKEAGYRKEVSILTPLIVTGVSKTGFVSPKRIGSYGFRVSNLLSRKKVDEIPEETSPEDKGVLAYSFYIPEMECKSNKLDMGFNEYDAIELGGDTHNSGGAPLEKLERNHVYQLLCRFMSKTSTLDINLTVCPWEYLPPQIEEVKGEIKMTNCYMVTPGERVGIPTTSVYKIWAQQAEFGNVPVPDGNVTAELVWQDKQGVIADGGITVVNASEREKAYLQIRTAKEGNAVVAMKVNGEIYWSWHIWCTDYEPNVAEGQKSFNNLVWMDRNLGAMTNEYTTDGGVKGLLYEWGRKDPFPDAENWTQKEKTLYKENSVTTSVRFKAAEVENLVESVREPLTYITNEQDWGDWYTNSSSLMNHSLWLPDKKTIFDPCPIGWRVPPGNQPWKGLQAGSTATTQGMIHPEAGYYPSSDKRMPQNGSLARGLSHWASMASVSSAYPLGAYGYGLGEEWQPFWRADGRSVRCVKE